VKKQTKTLLAVAGVAAVAVGGFLYWKSKHPAAALSLPGSTKPAGSNVIQLTLTPGTMSAVTLNSANSDGISFFAPTGATLVNINDSPAGPLAAPASGAPFEVVAAAPGATTLTVGWTNASGSSQTSSIPIVVT
jgi:hypothetical protein